MSEEKKSEEVTTDTIKSTSNTATASVLGIDASSSNDSVAVVKTVIVKEEPKKEVKKGPEVFGKDRFEEIFSNTPKITIGKKDVDIDLSTENREFDSGIRSVDVFRCAGETFKFKIDKKFCKVFDVKDQAVANAVARSLLSMYESSTYSTV